ncbi:TPA: peptidase E [Candidatus Woesearchaeota archaeon]|nr:peptidase E [Candidatus Woesearchaeota archaeon]
MSIKRKIVAIGGGDIRRATTIAIDEEILRLSGKQHPRLLFIPTASSDSEGYWLGIDKYFRETHRCRTDVLYLLNGNITFDTIKTKILSADIIYVGGGNTLKMMRRWRRMNVDRLLRIAWKRGIVLCGISAGSICWFDSGHSDSMSFYRPKNWNYINVRGLGFVKGVHCPHYDGKTLGVLRTARFKQMMRKIGGIGIAVDNNCAIEFVDDTFRVIVSKPRANAYRIYKTKGKLVSEKIPQKKEFLPIASLYKR